MQSHIRIHVVSYINLNRSMILLWLSSYYISIGSDIQIYCNSTHQMCFNDNPHVQFMCNACIFYAVLLLLQWNMYTIIDTERGVAIVSAKFPTVCRVRILWLMWVECETLRYTISCCCRERTNSWFSCRLGCEHERIKETDMNALGQTYSPINYCFQYVWVYVYGHV